MRIVTGVVWAAVAGLLVAGCSTTAGVAEPEEEVTVTVTDTVTSEPSTPEPAEPTTETEAPETESTTDLPQPTSPQDPDGDDADADGTIPAEPENPPAASDACGVGALDIGLDFNGGAAGSMIYEITFTNTSDASCTLHGFPEVMYVRGDKGIQVGAPATRDGDVGPAVTLAPGNTAIAMLQQVNVYNFDADACDPVDARGLRIYPPGSDKAAFVEQDDAVGCANEDLPGGQFQMSVQTVTAN